MRDARHDAAVLREAAQVVQAWSLKPRSLALRVLVHLLNGAADGIEQRERQGSEAAR